jgi:CRISPR-associated protein Cas2
MVVIVLTACPAGLRGYLTRWFLEVSPGVFVGRVPSRVRDKAWGRVVEMIGRGRALLVHSTPGEQGLAFRTHGHDWKPVDFDGIQLMMRKSPDGMVGSATTPTTPEASRDGAGRPDGWSSAARRRKFGRSTFG